MAKIRADEARQRGGTPHGSDTGVLAFAELVAGELDGCERFMQTEPAVERSLADELRATIAYLRGDFCLATRLAGGQAAGSVLASALLYEPVAELLARQPMPHGQKAALATVIGLPTTVQLDTGRPAPGPATYAGSDRAADLEAGIAAALILGATGSNQPHPRLDPSPAWMESQLELLTATTTTGCRLSLSVPISLERAIAAGEHHLGYHEAAADRLSSLEEHWRTQHAYTELAEVLMLAARVNATLDCRALAERQASEAHALAERLGMTGARDRALALHHPPSPDSEDLGSADERLVLMSDVVSSTKVSAVDGDEAYVELIMTHHGTVRRRLAEHGGTEFSEGGDSLFAWFESPEDTLDCALTILKDVADLQPTACGLEIRIAVAGGEPFFRDGRPYGSVVNRASLIIGLADPGTVVVDEATLTRLGPVISGFASETIDLGHFGDTAIGRLVP
ncbi:MAG: adenylate/guanylate cyclase domain-containing protein [Acidimicrobiales bacterium]